MNAKAIADALSLLNVAIAATSNASKYRQIVSQAVAGGRDITDEELLQASADLQAAIDAAEKA